MNQTKHNKCLICNNHQLSPLPKYNKDYLVKCKRCGFVFCSKIPTENELEKYYSTHYSREDYDSPITRKRYNELLDILEKYRKTNNILDIGCGIGYFLEEAKKRGWNVYGTEYTQEALNICKNKGITMHKGSLNKKNYDSISFDVITSFEVIEHINTPIVEILKIHSLLRNGGCFYLTTPNFNSLSRKFLKERWSVITYPEHLCYYTSETYRRLIDSNGFKLLSIKTTGISLTRFKKTVLHSNQKFISAESDDERLRLATENKFHMLIAKKSINTFVNLFKIGDTIKSFSIKN